MQLYLMVSRVVEICCVNLQLIIDVVDGGHRAIKYTRLNGVKPDIYNEGTHLAVCTSYRLLSHHAFLMRHLLMDTPPSMTGV